MPKKKALNPDKRTHGCPKERTSEGTSVLGLPAYDEPGADVGRFTKGLHRGMHEECKGIYAFGFKFHTDAAEGGVPISYAISCASLHDSQAAIPLATMTQQRGTNCHDLMDSACDAMEIRAHCEQLKNVPIIDTNPRNRKAEYTGEQQAQRHAGFTLPERVRYGKHSTVEHTFGHLRDEFGARHVRVRGCQKLMCQLMFGVVVLALDQLLRMIQ